MHSIFLLITKNKTSIFLLFIYFLISNNGYSQNGTVKGKIVEASSSKPVEFANVYFNNSLTGTVSDTTGHYILKNIEPGSYVIIVSFVGYEPYRKTITVASNDTLVVNVFLKPSLVQLSEVEVKGKVDAKWKRQLNKFEGYLFGPDVGDKDCEILNPGYLTFDDNPKTDSFTAESKVPLEIINHKLGYKIYFTLRQFSIYKGALTYFGDTHFEALKAETSKELITWEMNRNEAYRGSLRDFFKNLIDNTLQQNNFLAYQVLPSDSYINSRLYADKLGKVLIPLNLKNMVFKGANEGNCYILSRLPIEIIYTGHYTRDSPYPDMPYEVSRIVLNTGRIELSSNGFVYDPTSFTVTGGRAGERMGDMLPREFKPTPVTLDGKMPDLSNLYSHLLDSLSGAVGGQGPWQNQEGVYFNTDKPYYVAGDAIWYNARLLDDFSRRPEDGPRVVYVELVTPSDSVLIHQTLQAVAGIASGRIDIPENIPEGCYLLRGYTNWMRNFSDAEYTGKTLMIHSGINQVAPSETNDNTASADTLILKFYPESGNLVNSLETSVGIKATNRKGTGVLISGSLTDERGKMLESVKTNAMGIGLVDFKPDSRRQYFLDVGHINLRTVNLRYPLPPVKDSGIIMQATVQGNSFLKVEVTGTRDYKDHGVILMAQSGGKVFDKEAFYLEGTEKTIWLYKSRFPAGVLQLSLFDLDGNNIGQRLVFIDHPQDQPRVTITTSKPEYNPDEPVSLQIKLENSTNNPVSASLSVSVTANDLFNESAYGNPLPEIMLQSQFFEPIQDPGYYFRDTTAATRNELENFMLTMDHYKYDWKTMNQPDAQYPYKKEASLDYSGIVMVNRKACASCMVNLYPLNQNLNSISFTTSGEGKFSATIPDKFDTADYIYTVTNIKGKEVQAKIRFFNFSPYKVGNAFRNCTPEIPTDEIKNYSEVFESIKAETEKLKTIMLNEVSITKKPIKIQNAEAEDQSSGNHVKPDKIVDFSKLNVKFSNMTQALVSTVTGFSMIKSSGPGGEIYYKFLLHGPHSLTMNQDPLFIIDGMSIGENSYSRDNAYSMLNSLNPDDIDRVEVYTGSSTSFWGSRGANGVIAIYTKKGGGGGEDSNDNNAAINKLIKLAGYSPEVTFNPVQRDSSTVSIDKKITIFWADNLHTDQAGIVNLHFVNAANASYFTVHVNGVTSDGTPFSYVEKTGH